MALASRVNAEINARVSYRPDSGDRWEPATLVGDCEDYALAKRARLIAAGWPEGALRLALCRTEIGEAHLVLTIDTEAGTFVLDNRRSTVLLWTKLPYQWIAREVPGKFMWEKIGGKSVTEITLLRSDSNAEARGIRNNNPGNIEGKNRINETDSRHPNDSARWQGLATWDKMTLEQQEERRFLVFADPTSGIRAIAVTLLTYYDKRRAHDGSRIDTIQELVERWAPKADDNDPKSYAKHLARYVHKATFDPVDFHDFKVMRALVEGIIVHENGVNPYTDSQIDAGIIRAGIVPEKRGLQKSRTVRGGQVAAGSTVVNAGIEGVQDQLGVAQDTLMGLTPFLEWAQWGLLAITMISVGYMLWCRWDDMRSGINP